MDEKYDYEIDSEDLKLRKNSDRLTIMKNKIIESLRKIHDMENKDCLNMYYISGGLSFLNIMKYSEKNIDEKIENTKLEKYTEYFRTYEVDIVCKDSCFDYLRTTLYNILTNELIDHDVKEVTEKNRSLIYIDEEIGCKIINEKILEKIRNNVHENEHKIEKFKKWPQTFMRFQMILNLAYNNFLNRKYYENINNMGNKQEIINAICDMLCGDGINKINTDYTELEDYYNDDNIRYMGLFSIMKRTVRSLRSGLNGIEHMKNINEIGNYLFNNNDLYDKKEIIFFRLKKEEGTNNMILDENYIFEEYCNEMNRLINKQTDVKNKYLKYRNKYISMYMDNDIY